MPLWAGLPARALTSAAMLAACVTVMTLAVCFLLGGTGINIATLTLIQISAVLSLAVFSGNSGIVSFGHAAFMGLGAYVSGVLTMSKEVQATALPQLPGWLQGHELPLAEAMLAVVAAGFLAGILTAYPLSRLSSGSAAIGTLAFLIIIHVILIGARDFTRGSQTFYGVPRLTTVSIALVVTVIFIAIARLLRDLPLGLKLRASRENEVAAAATGVDVRQARIRGWVISIIMATVAGALYGHFLGAFSPKDFYFDLTFMLVAMLIVGGMLTVTGAVAGTVLLAAIIQLLRQAETGIDLGFIAIPGIFGLPQLGMGLALLLTIWKKPLGLVGLHEIGPPRLGSGIGNPSHRECAQPDTMAAQPQGKLVIKGITVRFGGLAALDDVSFEVPPGKVTGLIGPNGAGKTTLINVICGQLLPTSGQIVIDGKSVTGQPAHQIAGAGLARTFQNIRLFDRMTVFENVAVAALSKGHGLAEADDIAMEQLDRFGLTGLENRLAGSLAYGIRKRLEIARALALSPAYLLLDEPAAGMNPVETEDLIAILVHLRSHCEIGLLVIEHDMRLIMRLSDRLVVLNKGQKIAEGTPDDIRGNPTVIEAYIGTKRQVKSVSAVLAVH